jgi:hypothetical protein
VTDQEPAGGAAPAPEAPAAGPPATARRPGGAGIGSIFVLAFLAILGPGVVVYVVAHAVGLGLPPATLLGLLTVIVCLALYPTLLLRLGWVKRDPRRRAAGRTR